MMSPVSEAEMSRIFTRILQGEVHTSKLPSFATWLPETKCLQGRPDFVATRTDRPHSRSRSWLTTGLATPSLANVVSLLSARVARTFDYLTYCTGLSVPVLRRNLSRLNDLDLVKCVGQSQFMLKSELPTSKCEFWAFELKVSHWQSALYQARLPTKRLHTGQRS